MFWSRRIRPPLTTFQRVDMELRMRRTIETVGKETVFQRPMVTDFTLLPLASSTPEERLRSASAVLADFLPPAPEGVELRTGSLEELRYPAVYRPATGDVPAQILIAEELLQDPLRTLMELAYQHASHYWHHVPNPRPLDTNPRTTHLLPICCGLGVLASDASFYDQQWSRLGYSGWSMSRSGFYTAEEIGYALALLALLRGDDHPAWLPRLRPDSRVTAQRALRYFNEQRQQGRPMLIEAEPIPSSQANIQQLAGWLGGNDVHFALAAAWVLSQREEDSAALAQAVVAASASPDQDLALAATRLLARIRRVTHPVRERVTELIGAKHPATALVAVEAAQRLGIPLKPHQRQIERLLRWCGDDCLDLLRVIAVEGHSLADLAPQICRRLGSVVQSDDHELTEALTDCLCRIVEDPAQSVQRHVRSLDARKAILQRLHASVDPRE